MRGEKERRGKGERRQSIYAALPQKEGEREGKRGGEEEGEGRGRRRQRQRQESLQIIMENGIIAGRSREEDVAIAQSSTGQHWATNLKWTEEIDQ